MIKIQTSGDYVQLIYVDPVQESVQQELKSDTDAFECSYDSEGKLYLQFGLMRFENPDPTDFEINGVAVTDAADFISKLNALFTGGGGSGSSLLPTTGTGTATGNVIGDLDGNSLQIKNGATVLLSVAPASFSNNLRATDGTSSAEIGLTGDSNDPTVTIEMTASHDGNEPSILIDAVANSIRLDAVLNLTTRSAPGSPVDGDVWREDNTNTGLKIRINGVTKTITVS